MSQNAQKIYDRKLEESKGPSFGLIGMGLVTGDDGLMPSGVQIDPKSLYNSQRRGGNQIMDKAGLKLKRAHRGSNSVRPPQKLDFNLSGVNIPVQGQDMMLNNAGRPPLPVKGRMFPPPRVHNKDLHGELISQNNKLVKRDHSDLRLNFGSNNSSKSVSNNGIKIIKLYII